MIDFSVKMVTLLYIPAGSGTRLSFIIGFSNNFQLFVNDQLAIDIG